MITGTRCPEVKATEQDGCLTVKGVAEARNEPSDYADG